MNTVQVTGTNGVVFRQIDQLIDALEEYNKKLPNPRVKENYIFLRSFFKNFIKDNNSRADDIASKEYQKIKKFANSLFPALPLWLHCIDGRVLRILAHGASASVGSSIRVPGGMLREFVRGKDGKLKLKEDSDFARYLTRAFDYYHVDTIAEVFDSHLGCAARLAEEQVKGRSPGDSGLLADISHKLQMAQATREFAEKNLSKDKKVFPILTSFDPHTGFLYMGLERKEVFDYAYRHGRAYSEELLQQFVNEGKIISTEAIVADETVQAVLRKYAFPFDWKNNYIQTAGQFWHMVAKVREELAPILMKTVKTLYPELAGNTKYARREAEERVMLLLTNIVSGFLNNQHPLEQGKKHTDADHIASFHRYPYGVHKEEGIRVSEGASPPYQISLFAVFSEEEANLVGNIELSAALIRKNRQEGRVVDVSGNFTDPQTFSEAAIPTVVQEIVRDTLTKEDWKKIEKIDWSNLPEQWDTMPDEAFFSYLKAKGLTHMGVALGINNLRKRMAVLYYPYYGLSSRLVEQYNVVLPIIVDKFRKNHFIVPFVKFGFE